MSREVKAQLLKSSRGAVHAVEVDGLRWDIEVDPDLPEQGITLYYPRRVIRLREWDSEVLLHELIHVAFAVGYSDPKAWWGPGYRGDKRLTDDEQEAFTHHLSKMLDGIGYRLDPLPTDYIVAGERREVDEP